MVKLSDCALADARLLAYTTRLYRNAINTKGSAMAGSDLGFNYRKLKNGDVVISHRGRNASTLRGDRAADFLEDMQGVDLESQQQELARITGNYRRGNERLARQHPRNR